MVYGGTAETRVFRATSVRTVCLGVLFENRAFRFQGSTDRHHLVERPNGRVFLPAPYFNTKNDALFGVGTQRTKA